MPSFVSLPGVMIPEVAAASDDPNGGNATIAVHPRGDLTLTPGTYVFDDLTLNSNATLNVTGKTTIYITGHDGGGLDLAGKGVANAGPPSNLVIYVGPRVSKMVNVKVTGSASAHYAVYAPTADITVSGNSGIFGALVGRTVVFSGGGSLQFDSALAGSSSRLVVASWQRL